MRRIASWAAVAAILAVPAAARGQQADTKGDSQAQAAGAAQPESIADAARRARDAKKEQPKASKVFDNDNLPGGTISTVGKASEPKEGEAAKGEQASAGEAKSGADQEKLWRQKFSDLRAKLDHDKEALEVMQRELGVLNLQNYQDPVKGMQQGMTRSDINKKTADIDAQQKAIQADQQAIDDAEEELRKSGGDSGWAR